MKRYTASLVLPQLKITKILKVEIYSWWNKQQQGIEKQNHGGEQPQIINYYFNDSPRLFTDPANWGCFKRSVNKQNV